MSKEMRVRCESCGLVQFAGEGCRRCSAKLPEPIVNIVEVEVVKEVRRVVELRTTQEVVKEVVCPKCLGDAENALNPEFGPLPTMRNAKNQLFRQAFAQTGGDALKAAALLKVGKTTVYRKFAELGLRSLPAVLLALAAAWSGAQRTTVVAGHLQDAAGGPLGTSAAPGEVCVQVVDQNNHPFPASLGGGGGQILMKPGCAYVVNGAIGNAVSGGTFQVPDTSQTIPTHVCLRFTFKDAGGVPITPPGYECLQPTGGTFNLDTYTPGGSTVFPVFLLGVSAINNTTGPFTFTGSGVSCSGSVCTFGGAGCGVYTAQTETPAGAINGANTAFTLTHAYVNGGSLSYNSYPQTGSQWSASGTALTLTFAPESGDSLSFSYCY